MKTEPEDTINTTIAEWQPYTAGNLGHGYQVMRTSGGLTKREHFTSVILQGLLAYKGVDSGHTIIDSVKLADMVIAELNKDE